MRPLIKELYLRNKNLEGQLNLSDFINLERLDCSSNQLTSLNLVNLKHLKVLYCDNNYLENIDFLNHLNSQKITSIIIDNNNLPKQDISVFSPFTNLEELRIGSTIIRNDSQGEIYNRFYGSLKSLENLIRLEDLNISNTDINDGAEFLPKNVKRINYSTSQRPESKLKEITEKIKSLLLSRHEVYFASYLREKGYEPSSKLDLEELRKEDKNKIDCYHNQFTSLTLKNCPKLTRVVCSQGTLTDLNIENCPEINNLNVSDNLLNNLSFLTDLDSNKITHLYLTNNKFPEQSINIFSKFSNLKYLYLANNSFIGSLQSLKDLNKLQTLSIVNTKINSGFEYLSDSLSEISSNVFQELDKNGVSGVKIVRWANLMTPSGYQKVPYYDFQY
nr:6562_t:CDS:2 [Entrophospora candida]